MRHYAFFFWNYLNVIALRAELCDFAWAHNSAYTVIPEAMQSLSFTPLIFF